MRYFLVQHIRRPNGQIDEQASFSKKLKTSDHQTMNVILDYAENRVVQCVIEGKRVERDFESLSAYYENWYPQIVKQLKREAPTMAKAEPDTGLVEDDTESDSDQP